MAGQREARRIAALIQPGFLAPPSGARWLGEAETERGWRRPVPDSPAEAPAPYEGPLSDRFAPPLPRLAGARNASSP
ncbi:hypothetical protein FJ949_24555 [Mesorhizobium sp. B2-4-1]|nr:hypothetical protein FJ947_23995 [Mesorhizobium sp. B2-4-8]TPL60696.1 hypothetical protein FJ949_24555 [Mesorhizobium sp. B2-4-1]